MLQANIVMTAARTTGAGRHSRYVGRVGALAVALGVGVAIAATPGVAWAGPETDSSNNLGTGNPAPESTANDSASPEPDAAEASPQPTSDLPSKSATTATIGDSGSPQTTISVSGGANSAINGVPADSTLTTDIDDDKTQLGDGTMALSEAEPFESNSLPKNDNTSRQATPAPEDPITAVAAAVVNVTRSLISLAVPGPSTSTPTIAPATSARSVTVTETETEKTAIAPKTTVAPGLSGVVTQLIASVLAPFFSPTPESPPAPTLIWTVLAWIRREIDTTTTALGTTPTDETLTSEAIAPTTFARVAAPTTALAAAAAAATPPPPPPSGIIPTVSFVVAGVGNIVGGLLGGLGALFASNQAPVNGTATASSPNLVSGQVTVTATASDPNNDPLTFSAPASTTKGTITTNANGTFTYTPNAAARLAAEASPGPDTDSFAVTVSDGRGGTTTIPVTVTVAPTLFVNHSVTLPGTLVSGSYNADKTRYVASMIAYDPGTNVTTVRSFVIDTTTGSTVGSPTILATTSGAATTQTVMVSPDGRRTVLALGSTNPQSGQPVTKVTVMDNTTGARVGNTVTLAGTYSSTYTTTPAFTVDGTRLVFTTTDSLAPTADRNYTTYISVIDVTAGNQLGSTIAVAGRTGAESLNGALLTADGRRAVVTTSNGSSDYFSSPDGQDTSWVTIIDTATGTRVGSTLAINGRAGTGLTNDGSRAVVTSEDFRYDSNGTYTNDSTRVALLDTSTGALVGQVRTLDGLANGAQFDQTSDGTRILIRWTQRGTTVGDQVTRSALIDPATGNEIGTFSTNGTGGSQYILGNRVIVETSETNGTMRIYDVANGNQVGGPIAITGTSYLHPKRFIADRNTLVITSYTFNSSNGSTNGATNVTVVNLTTGTKVGSTVTVAGQLHNRDFTSDGSRVVVVTESLDAAGAKTARVAVVNTTTGTQVGNTVTASGGTDYGQNKLFLTPDGTRALITPTTSATAANPNGSTTVLLVDTVGGQLKNSVVVPGRISYDGRDGAQFVSPDGSRIVLFTYSPAGSAGTNWITVLNATTGAQLGTSVTTNGYPYEHHFALNGARVVVSSGFDNAMGTDSDSSITTIDLATGTRVGQPFVVLGNNYANVEVPTTTGPNAVIPNFTYNYDPNTDQYSYTANLALVDTTTGARLGGPFTVSGLPTEAHYRPADKYATVISQDFRNNATTFNITHIQTG